MYHHLSSTAARVQTSFAAALQLAEMEMMLNKLMKSLPPMFYPYLF
jgi:hypothetical protein